MERNNVTSRKTEEAPKLCKEEELSIEQPFDILDNLDQSLQDDQNSSVIESGVITDGVEMTEIVTKSHMPEGLQPDVNIDEISTSSVFPPDNLIQNQMSDELQDVHTKTNENGAMENIPSLFKKCMVWPADIKNMKNKKKPARKVSTVLTSEEWQKQQLQIQEEKLRKQKEIEERKKLREEAKKRKAEEKQIKKAALEEKKKLDQEIKRLMAQKKRLESNKKKLIKHYTFF
ncbi:uncharacterized protein [Temnothorax nylanderi]|uniref:uncharacterized protein n=1 Tax=Temnothorax nylanderi TaxID=102681 RepID=UPI003A867BAF